MVGRYRKFKRTSTVLTFVTPFLIIFQGVPISLFLQIALEWEHRNSTAIHVRACVHYSNMSKLTIEQIRRRFETASLFNELFDAFEQAIGQRIEDLELYRQLFWNKSLNTDEICLFGQKLAHEFPRHAFDIYLWLASMFAVNYAIHDNYELALEYFEKAAAAKPDQPTPYLDAAACYEPDLNIPPITRLISFLKIGSRSVPEPRPLFEKLAGFYEMMGNDEMYKFYRRKIEPGPGGISSFSNS